MMVRSQTEWQKSKAVPLHAMEEHGGERRYSSYSYLTSATRWGWVISVTPRPRFTPGTHWIGGWVGLGDGLDEGARRKILCPCRGSNLDQSDSIPNSEVAKLILPVYVCILLGRRTAWQESSWFTGVPITLYCYDNEMQEIMMGWKYD
jgi:hypothetical protein